MSGPSSQISPSLPLKLRCRFVAEDLPQRAPKLARSGVTLDLVEGLLGSLSVYG